MNKIVDVDFSGLHSTDEALQYIKDYEVYTETIGDVWENCVIESVFSIFYSVCKAILINLMFGLVTSFAVPALIFHCLSGLSGVYMLYSMSHSTVGLIIVFSYSVFTYLLLVVEVKLSSHSQTNQILLFIKNYNLITYQVIIVLVLFEYGVLDPEVWLSIRGVVMILTMKLISLANDVKTELFSIPSITEYFGYMFCGGNLLFGPWIKYKEYILLNQCHTVKSVWWIVGVAKALCLSLLCLSISNCWLHYFISDESGGFIVGYKQALTFRTSHYFISYLSEALMLAAGWKTFDKWSDNKHWEFRVTNPSAIEFPQALAIVVVNWNIPVHRFLKEYVYRKWLPLGKFYAILLTFVISSLLHGFEKKVSIVLILIGLFSVMQMSVRDYFAQTFDSCIRVHPCRDCQHLFKRNSVVSKAAMFIFSCFTVVHLIYLGVIMDYSTDEVGLYQKWSDLYFISFWIMFMDILIVK
ncbi:protein-serine O-palmitoleoyltransferase porcupine [Cylas formicarius]|uniref:protein-serine O-palmitoleoyltransferase porcupine n=1 Tax=Cylas formicarius TaxID=197179 RepID=UPI0029588C4C|nr:protein-serine O-palmitoleoyltransferase porcupine [Cylas formicarius]